MTMKESEFGDSLALRLNRVQRTAIEALAERNRISLGAAAREFLNAGMVARGIEV